MFELDPKSEEPKRPGPVILAEGIEEAVEVVSEGRSRQVDEVVSDKTERRAIPREATLDDMVSQHSWPVQLWSAFGSAVTWIFGLISLLLGLAFLAAIPIVQFLSLGYLLEASGRIARTGKFSSGLIGFRKAGRIGSVVLGTWLLLLPLRFISDLWYSAQLMAPHGRPTLVLRGMLFTLTVLFVANVILAWYSGGKLRHFFWFLLAPIFFGMWMLRRIVASERMRPLIRPLLVPLSPRLLADVTAVPRLDEWFPPAIFLSSWRRGGVWGQARDAVWDFVVSLRLSYYFSLGARGFFGAVLWLAVPAILMIGMTRLPAAITEAGVQGGTVTLVTFFAGLSGFVGTILMAMVLLYLPFLQTHFAAENRFSAMFELGTIRKMFRQAPVAYWLALLITFLFALPLFLLKIEYTLRELLWIPSLVFVVFIYPARLITGWAIARARLRVTPRHFLIRTLARLAEIPVVGFYVFILFFTQHISWSGAWSLLEQPPFLLPAPFFVGM